MGLRRRERENAALPLVVFDTNRFASARSASVASYPSTASVGIFDPSSFSMSSSYAFASGLTNEMEQPASPARPVRPMRCT